MKIPFKNIAITAGILVILGAAILFRDQISGVLSFHNNKDMSLHPDSAALGEETREDVSTVLPEEDVISEKTSPGETIQNTSNIPSAENQMPNYTGRDPTEIRPVPEEVKLFTEEQKQQLYATLETHGRAVKADPLFFNGWIQLGLLKKTIGDFIGARDAWEYAGVIQPLNSTSFSNLGELYWRYLHDYVKSEKSFRTSIAHKSTDTQNYISLAELYHYSYVEKKEQADDVLLEGIAANPAADTPQRYEALARRLAYLYEQRQEWAKAVERWEKVLGVAP